MFHVVKLKGTFVFVSCEDAFENWMKNETVVKGFQLQKGVDWSYKDCYEKL